MHLLMLIVILGVIYYRFIGKKGTSTFMYLWASEASKP